MTRCYRVLEKFTFVFENVQIRDGEGHAKSDVSERVRIGQTIAIMLLAAKDFSFFTLSKIITDFVRSFDCKLIINKL